MRSLKHTIITSCLALILLCTLFLSSCNKLIEIPANPPDKIAADQTFADSTNVISAIVGIYTNFRVVDNFSLLLNNGGITAYSGLSADELRTNPFYNEDAKAFFNNALLPVNNHLGELWRDAYSSLFQVNACLEGVNGSKGISEGLRRQLTGEIKVVRALYYFNLVNLFGAVPLVLGTDYRVNAKLPRSSVDSVYAQVIADLTDARQLLPATYPSAGRARPNLYTATALLAKAYLYRQQWVNAANLASQVINAGPYSLETDPNSVFLDGSQEAIWQLPGLGNYSQTNEAGFFVASFDVPAFIVENALLNAFEPGDQRKEKWLGSISVGGTDYYYPYKYKNTSPVATPVEGYMVSRLAEQYLIRSEALAHQDKLDSALKDINALRQRAGLPDTTGATQTAVLNINLHERQTELFCEWGNRWFDLRRTGSIDAVLGAEKTGWQPFAALYPIPLTELQSNPFLLQNPGYH